MLGETEAKMAFWKKDIELPQDFYRSAAQVFFAFVQINLMARDLGFSDTFFDRRNFKKPSDMTFNQAYELFGFAQDAYAKLQDLLDQYPIKL